MAAHGTVTVYVYTSDAQIPLEGAAVTITRRLPDGAQELPMEADTLTALYEEVSLK